MKAAACTRYRPPEVLQIKEVERPSPKADEVLVKVHATTATKYDCWQRSCTAPPGFWLLARASSGLTRPKRPILGTELSGEVESTGNEVTRLKKGDSVFGYSGMGLGAYAEYACLPEKAMALKPTNASYKEAAAMLQGPLTALFFLRKGNIKSGSRVLIFGASGGVGTAAVQLCKYFGAEVTAVCGTTKQEFARSLGADRVIDYTKQDFSRLGQTYDIVLDTIGKTPVSGCKRALNDGGFYLLTTFGLPKLARLMWLSMTSNKKVFIGALKEETEDLIFVEELIEAGKLKAVIDRTYPLEQADEAHRYVETGQKQGSVVITAVHGE
jgi:NADPH:quinone reductase-like Zn-dependent oxidoreductase